MRRLRLLISLPLAQDRAMEPIRQASPGLHRLLRRGRTLPAVAGRMDILGPALGLARQQDWPVAPLCLRMDGLDPGNGYWLRVDPVHLGVGMGGLMLDGQGQAWLDHDQAATLVSAINETWKDSSRRLVAPHPHRWYLRLPGQPALATEPPDQVAGEYLTDYLPRGADAAGLLRLLNDAQMVLHGHPLNEDLEARGLPTVNGLWPWGGGVAAAAAPEVDLVASPDDEPRLLAAALGIETMTMPDCYRALSPGRHQDMLACLAPGAHDAALDDYLARLDRDWFQPLGRDLARGRLRRLDLHLLCRPATSWVIGTLDCWKIWR